MACEIPVLQHLVIVAYYLSQVPMGILPTGHTPSMYSCKYSQGPERTPDHSRRNLREDARKHP
jgi:hypothetical protein